MTEKEIIKVLLFIAKKEQQTSAVYHLEYTGKYEEERRNLNTKNTPFYRQMADSTLKHSAELLECIQFLEEKLAE